MTRSFLHRNKGKLASLAAAVLLVPVSANAWWGGYGYPGWACDPQWAYMEEYGFLDPFGPSPADLRRLSRDQWRAARYGPYYGNYRRLDPVAKAVRRQCHGWRRSYYW
jgi:hypothetical protein